MDEFYSVLAKHGAVFGLLIIDCWRVQIANTVWSKNKELTKSAVKQVAKFVGIASPLAALALGVGVDLIIPDENSVDNVEYAIFNSPNNKDLFMNGQSYRAYQRGFGTGGYGRIDEPTCPECGHPVIHDGGCVVCQNCGWSKCV